MSRAMGKPKRRPLRALKHEALQFGMVGRICFGPISRQETVIDNIEKSMALVERMQAALPVRAFTNMELRRTLQEESKRVFPHECTVTEIRYMGDEGGIACHLDFGFSDTKNVYVVSITHPSRRSISS